MGFINPDQETIFNYLKEAKRIAVFGLSNNPDRTSYQIAEDLQRRGYEIIPVNPTLAGQEILKEKVYATLMDVPGKIDIVDVFRRSEYLADVAREFIQTDAKVFWAQLELESQEAASVLANAGRNDVIMNRCIAIELRLLDAR
ncbi:CoA-binding protein [Vagococcus sp. BWB3-3]|uniref:CoA-binding protein n=1 Tax=Vagococcus allomyrinae TaxID=2794353 RepID=A0A940PBG8_9ENTE|nr:CoA-binding protein [Vagococcus allomyrinae]MBP1041695.1 CoA-binding protein [Vagococcus allomyrinae]